MTAKFVPEEMARTLDAMETFGGRFVMHLAACYRFGTEEQQLSLRKAFPGAFVTFRRKAEKRLAAARLEK